MTEELKKPGRRVDRKRLSAMKIVMKGNVSVRSNAIERERNEQPRRNVRLASKKRANLLKSSALTTVDDPVLSIERNRGTGLNHSDSRPSAVVVKKREKLREKAVLGPKTNGAGVARTVLSNKHVDATTYSPSTDSDTVNKRSCDSVSDNNNVNKCNESGLGSDFDSLPPYMTLSSQMENASPNAGFCDKLSCTFTPSECSSEKLEDVLQMLSEPNERGYYLKRLGGKDGRLYQHTFELLNVGGDRQIALMQMKPRRKEHNFFRFELNPNAIGPDGVYEVKRILKALFGRRFRDDLRSGNITRLDAAVDVYKIRPDDLLVFSASARQSGLFQRSFDKSGRETFFAETYTIGSQTSDYFACCYDKTAQLSRVKAQEVDDLITRVEVRLKPRTEDGEALKVESIGNARNPFSSLVVAYYPKPDDTNYVFNLFVLAARTVGAERALKIISDKRVRSKFWNLLQDSIPNWWCPDKHWEEVLESLKATELFPKDIFRDRRR